MENEIPISLTNKPKNFKPINTTLKSKYPLIPDYKSFNSFQTSIKNKTKSTNEITYTKNINTNIKNTSDINSKLSNVFKKPKDQSKNKKTLWPKITHPKLPFSKRG